MIRALLLLAAAGALQDDPARLVERLRSDKIEERDEAAARLKKLGAAARPELARAARGSDLETAGRARAILAVIDVRAILTPRLLERRPGLDEQLARDGDAGFSALFLDLGKRPEMECDPPRADNCPEGFRPADLEALAPRALRGVRTDWELEATLDLVLEHRLRSVLPQVATLAATHESDRVRSSALMALGSLGHRESLPLLLRALQNSDSRVVEAGLYGLRRLGARDAAPALAKLLQDSQHREAAFNLLLEFRSPELLPEIRRRVKDGVFDRLHVPYAIVQLSRGTAPLLPRDEAETLLLKLLESRDGETAKHALWLLGDFRSRAAIPAIAKRLDDPDPDTVSSAAWTLGRLGAREHVPKLLAILKSMTAPREYDHVAMVLARLGGKEVAERLAEEVKTRPDEFAHLAFDALVEMQAPQAKADVLRRLKGPNPEGACDLAVKLGMRESIPILLDLRSPAASMALLRLGRKEGLEAVVPLLDGKGGWRYEEPLAESGLPEAADVFRERLKKGKITPFSARALATLGVKESIPLLRTWLDAGWESHRILAIEALGALGDRESVPTLRKILREDWPDARAAAAEALARLGAVEAIAEILPLLREPDPLNAERVVEALVVLGAASAVPELEKALGAPDRRVRVAAAAGLCELGSRKGISVLLDEEEKLESLNALRSPAAWKRLRSARIPESAQVGLGTRALVEALARSAGFKVEWPPTYYADYRAPWMRSSVSVVLAQTGSVVVEEGLVRVLTPEEAPEFWKAWASKR